MSKVIRQQRGDTLVRTIEKKYGVDLGYRSDTQLHTVLKKEGLPSLSKLLKMTENKKTNSIFLIWVSSNLYKIRL